MKTVARVAQLVVLLFVCVAPAAAQVATGTPPFASLSGGPDIINEGNLNVHLDVPILDTAGRGMPFSYHLTFDDSVWAPVTSSGVTKWSPVFNMGWLAQTAVQTGFISYSRLAQNCDTPPPIQQWITFKNFVYYDAWGRSHTFPGTMIWDPMNCSTGNHLTLGAHASDGSGLSLSAAITGNGAPTTHNIITKDGQVTNAPLNLTTGYSGATATATDRNGNQISVTSASNTATYTDTIGNSAITISGSGTSSSPLVFSYTPPASSHCAPTSSSLACFIVNYTNYTVATNFGVSGIGEYKSTVVVPLVSSITRPDGTQYTFTYEPTPSTPSAGACTPLTGTTCTTGRLASVTYPTGGTISYQYYGFTGCTTGNNGAFSDGSTSCMKRTTPDGTWTYTRALGTGLASTTTVIDPERDSIAPSGNETIIKFQGIYETERLTYTGLATTLLQTTDTCYNTAAKPCTATAITLPITQRDIYVTLGSQVAKHTTKYNSTYGMPTEQDDYDYGTGSPSTTPLQKELITYASLSNGIVSAPSQVTTQDGSGATLSQTTYTYDAGTLTTTGAPQHVGVSGSRGNPTTIARLVQGTTTLSTTNTYDDAGNVRIATDVNGAQTTYNYSTSAATCGFAFPSGVSEPLSMSRSFTWNCTGSVQTSVTDENGHATFTGYTTDPYFWRPNSTTDALSNTTSLQYSPGNFVSSMTFNGGSSEVETGLAFDGLGRQTVENHQHGPGVWVWDQVQKTYDSLGRLYQISAPCLSTGALTCPMGPSDHPTTNVYDALSRPTQTTDGEGGTISYTYTNNDVLVTIGPAPTGENTKKRQIQYDGLGRISSVCEITSVAPSGACGQNVSQSGYLTSYTYGPGNVVTVKQNAQTGGTLQTRTYNYDNIGRLTSETNPESGTTSYTYDVIPSGCYAAGTAEAGDLTRRQDPAGDNNCFIYDALHRVTSVGSTTGCKRFAYDNGTVTGSRPSGITTANSIGRMTEALTDNCSAWPPTPITDEWFSYSARGEILNLWESTPHSGGYYPVTAAYWANGPMSSLLGANGYSMTWGIDGEGRISSVGSGGATLNSTTYSAASQPTQLNFPSGDTDNFTYDSVGRMKSYSYTVNAQNVNGNLTWNANGTLGSLMITDQFNAANTQTCTYSHDDLRRIAGVNCGSTFQQTFGYDPFGNITKSSTGGGYNFAATYSQTTNHIISVGGTNATYDANGDITYDTVRNFTWDAFGNAATISTPGGSTSMIYDALDRMVEQNRSAGNTEFIYAPTGFKMQIMNGASATVDFVPLPGGASQVFTPSTVYYRHADWLGSSRFSSTSARAMYSDKAYAPFGEPYAQAGVTTDLNFTGMNSDTSSGLYDFLYREYSTQGRWSRPDRAGIAAVDSSNPQSWNRYSYVANSPLSSTDQLGLYTTCDGMWSYDQVDFQVDGTAAGSDRVLIGPCVWQSLQPWLYPPNYSGGGGGGGGSANSSLSGNQPPLNVPSLQAAARQNNLNRFNACVDQAASTETKQLMNSTGEIILGGAVFVTVGWAAIESGEAIFHELVEDIASKEARGFLIFSAVTSDLPHVGILATAATGGTGLMGHGSALELQALNQFDRAKADCQVQFGFPNVP